MSKKAKARVVVAKLFSSAGTGFMYALRRPRTSPKFELCKYDPIVGHHVLFTEKKVTAPKP
jgi:large subunit ribosomal protein L33